MRERLLRKILVVLIIIAPLFSYSGCKKQAQCGCGKDVLYSLEKASAKVYYNESGTNIRFNLVSDPYSTYNFCNPSEMFPNFVDYASGDILLVSGDVFWECNYIYQTSNYAYQTYYKVYMIQVSEVTLDLYGKK